MTTPATNGPKPIIELRDVTKRYYIQQRASPRIGAWLVNKLFEHFRRVPFHALDDINISIAHGEMIGFLGSNGAGKSTVLKLIAGITQPTTGTVRVRGRVASMLELGVGFHPDLSGMENIFLSGSMLGLTRAQILDRLPQIIAFSGLEPFIYEPVKHYSSGMYARLACSVAMHIEPDIILVDEILAVGDAEFQQRALLRLLEMNENGATILLVTHAISSARDLCQRLVWLDHGRVQADGPATEIAARYYAFQNKLSIPPDHFLRPREDNAAPANAGNFPRIASSRILNAANQPIDVVHTGQPVRISFQLEHPVSADRPWRLAFAVSWDDHRVMFEDAIDCEPKAHDELVYEIPQWPLLRKSMTLSAAIIDPQTNTIIHQQLQSLAFRTESPPEHIFTDVAMQLSAEWKIEPLDHSSAGRNHAS